ncbi:uncharacterized protein KY384_006410 [Bacidia gigantensis]|uniref:uncharacterized protein n=1 Tax=Bacidia gigantensis TaxID=2732470 RepID=UPI001D03DACC|nr:uncharacterized protein KY384_006410 [Bacidia gigantensis]KAG8528723.1 hypothetical protein KY384_006410 [Bacidia gigantensis]
MTDFNVGEMTARFLQLSEKTFKTNRGGIWSNFDPFNVFPAVLMAVKAWESKYRTTPLREGLVDLFGKDKPMFPPTTSTGNQRTVRVTVTSTTSGDPCIFTNYNRNISTVAQLRQTIRILNERTNNLKKPRYGKHRASALATSAAPIYFKPFQRGDPPKLYSDGALHANLPAEYALWETQKIWPTVHPDRPSDELHIDDAFGKDLISSIEALDFGDERADELDNIGGLMVQSSHRTEVHIDTLVSIGTGQQERVDKYPSAFEVGGLKQIYLSLIKAMDTEASWEDFRKKGSRKDVHQYRLNVPITGKYVALDDWDQMYRLAEAVRQEYLTNSRALNDVQDVASRLAASLLFFEPDAPDSSRLQPPDRWHRIHGQIWCRLPRDSSTIVALTDRITGFWIREDNPKMRLSHPTPVPLKDGWKSEIRTQGRHLSVPALIKTMEPDSTITLSVRLKDVESINDTLPTRERTYPISGFPILFKDLEAMVLAQ